MTASAMELGRLLMILVLAWLAFATVLRPMMRRALQPPPMLMPTPALAGGGTAKTIADMEGEIEAELDAGLASRGESRRLPILQRRIAKTAEESPEQVAKLVRSLLSDEER